MNCLSGEEPDPAEVFTIVRVSENRIALKTGYDRYVSVNSAGELVGRTEAIGPREMWEPVFEDVRNFRHYLLTYIQMHSTQSLAGTVEPVYNGHCVSRSPTL